MVSQMEEKIYLKGDYKHTSSEEKRKKEIKYVSRRNQGHPPS